MSLEILALFAILLAKAQKALTPAAAANEHQQAANQAAKDAADAAARGDHATAANKSAEAAAHAATAATAAKAARTPPPWPQVVPAELAPFPGPGWKPANPVTSAQSARAWQLLPELWKYGEGTWKVEKTADRWVVYKAAQTSPGKKGVIAYTTAQSSQTEPKMSAAQLAPLMDTTPASMRPQAPPAARPPMGPTVPASAPAPSASGLPTLRPPPAAPARGPAVIALQQRLGVPTSGTYDGPTIAAVHAFQLAHPATGDRNGRPDNTVGPKMWAALGFGQGRAAA
jgi:hypothetical protein